MRKPTRRLAWFTLAAVCVVSVAAQTKPQKKTAKRPATARKVIVTARPAATPLPSPKTPSDVKGETMGHQIDLTNPITPCEAAEGPTVEKLGKVYGVDVGEDKAAAPDSVLNGRAVSLPKPAYPVIAKAARAGGTVGVQIIIDEEGKVISARTVSGHPLLFATALQAACGARFPPTLLESKPIKVTGVINYNFVRQ